MRQCEMRVYTKGAFHFGKVVVAVVAIAKAILVSICDGYYQEME